MSQATRSPAFESATHREVLQFLWRHVYRHRGRLSFMALLLLCSTLLQLVQPFFYKAVVDIVASVAVHDAAMFQRILLMIGGGVLTGAAHLSLHEVSARFLGGIETRVMHDVHAEVFAHVQRLSTQFHVNAFAGATSRKIGRGVDAIETIMDRLWFNFLPLIVMTIGFLIVLSFFAPLLGIAMVCSIILYSCLSIWWSLILARYHSWTDRQDTRVTASLVDTITGNAVVKSFGTERQEESRHGVVLREWQQRLWKTWRIGSRVTWGQFMLLVTIEFVLWVLAAWLWFRGDFTAGGFIVVTFYVGKLWGFLFDIGQQVRHYLRAMAHAEEMVGLYATPIDVPDPYHAISLRVPRGAIAFRDVTFSYGKSNAPVFHNFSLDIEAGEKVALVGHSGGGKSTFVKLLQRLYDLQSGRITIDGQDIAEVTQESLRKAIGLVPQDPTLFHRSLADNIAYGKHHASIESIIDAAKKAHAHEFIEKLPNGYDTPVGERGIKLSGGERQRVAIARAILADTPILILDEATSSLDSLSESYIQEALDFLMQGRTTIVIAHRLSTIKKVDRILVIEDGNIAEEGSHNALLRREGGVYRGFYELQAGGFIGE